MAEPKKKAGPAKKTPAKTPAKPKPKAPAKPKAGGMLKPMKVLTAGHIATCVAKAGARGGTVLGLGYIGARPKIKASKVRPYMPLGVGLLGLVGEVMLNDDNAMASVLKGACEGMSTFGILDGAAQLWPDSKAEFGLAGYGGGEDTISGDNVDWQAMADQMAAEESGSPTPSMSGTRDGMDDDEDEETEDRMARGMAAA